jgi:hypothetical protein
MLDKLKLPIPFFVAKPGGLMRISLFQDGPGFNTYPVQDATVAAEQSISGTIWITVRNRAVTLKDIWRPELSVFVIYSLITILVTYPTSLYLTSALPSGLRDPYQHLWSLWWIKKALLDLHVSPANLTYLYYPTGMYHPLLWVTPYVHLLSIPLQSLLGLVGTYNVILLLSFPLSGLTMYLLAYYLTENRFAAFIAGLIFAFFPSKSAHLAGHYLQLPIYWFPLYVLYLFKLLHAPSRKNTVLCGAFLALSSLIHLIHTAYFVIPVTVIFLLFQLFAEPSRQIRLKFGGHFAIAAVIALAIVAPFYGPYLLSSWNGSVNYTYGGGSVNFSSDLLSFFVPSELHPLWKNIEPVRALASRLIPQSGNQAESVAYLGWLPLGLALIGVFVKRRQSTMWWILSLTAAIFSLGPLLHVNGKLVKMTFDGLSTYVVLPYAFLEQLPFYKWGRTPGRFNETVIFGLSILAAFGTQWLINRARSARLQWTGLAVVTTLIVSEYLVRWPAPVTATPPTSEFYIMAPGTPDDAILTFPSFYWDHVQLQLVGSQDMYFQTIHEHKIPGGYIWRWSPTQKGRVIALDKLLMPEHDTEIVDFPANNDVAAVLNNYGVRYVVVHKPWGRRTDDCGVQSTSLPCAEFGDYVDSDRVRASIAFRQMFGPPIFEDAVLWAFEVPNRSPQNPDNATMMYVGSGWYDVTLVDETPWRGMKNNAHLYVERLTPGYARLSFQVAGASEAWLDLIVNGQKVQRFPVSTGVRQYVTEPIALSAGRNLLIFQTPNLCINGEEGCFSMRFAALSLESFAFAVDHPADINLEQGLSLVRFGQSQETVYPGDPLTVTLTWRAQSNVAHDYKVFVHLIDSDGHRVAQHDSEPDEGGHPTSQWVPGALVRDTHVLLIPSDMPPGTYSIQVGMYLEETLERLAVLHSSEPSENNAIRMGSVQVLGPSEW